MANANLKWDKHQTDVLDKVKVEKKKAEILKISDDPDEEGDDEVIDGTEEL